MNNPQILLMGGEDPTYHNFEQLLPLIGNLLQDHSLDVTISTNPDQFLPGNIKSYHLILCYPFGHELTPAQEKGLLSAVRGDPRDNPPRTKGFLGLHGASCSFLNSEDYLRMLGGKFLAHPPLGELKVKIKHPEHPVMKGIRDFSIEDELYLVERYNPFQTLAGVDYRGFFRPVAWAKPYGLGRVVYLSLGHGSEQLLHNTVQQILINAVRWILRG